MMIKVSKFAIKLSIISLFVQTLLFMAFDNVESFDFFKSQTVEPFYCKEADTHMTSLEFLNFIINEVRDASIFLIILMQIAEYAACLNVISMQQNRTVEQILYDHNSETMHTIVKRKEYELNYRSNERFYFQLTYYVLGIMTFCFVVI
jgi:hypothetical protein